VTSMVARDKLEMRKGENDGEKGSKVGMRVGERGPVSDWVM